MAKGGKLDPSKEPRPLGYRAEQVVAFTLRFFVERGRLPTQSEICSHIGISTKGEVSRIEKGLRARGLKIDRSGRIRPKKPTA